MGTMPLIKMSPSDDSIVYAQATPVMDAQVPAENYTQAFKPEVEEKSIFPSAQAEHVQASANSPMYIQVNVDPWASTKKLIVFGVVGFLIYKYWFKRS